MDRGLQERLAGAAVLVALGVWLIPWVLDGSAVDDSSPADQAAIKLPAPEDSEGRIIRRQTIDLGAARGTLVKSPQDTPPDALQSPPEAAPAANAEPERARVAAADNAEPEVGPASPTTTPPPAPEATTPATQSAEPSPSSQPPIVAASSVDGWMVQLGSFSNAGNARRQAQRIGEYGHDARIYEFAAAGGRTMFRVRLGPVSDRGSAEETASSLAAHGFVAQVIAPE